MKASTEEIIEIVKKRAKNSSTITETSHLYEDLWISTSDFEEIAYEIQERFGESFSAEDFRSGKISTVGDIVDYLANQDLGSRSFHQQFDDNNPTTNSEEVAPAYEKPLTYILLAIVVFFATGADNIFLTIIVGAIGVGMIKVILKTLRIIRKIVNRNKR